jgi:hypothetical protein
MSAPVFVPESLLDILATPGQGDDPLRRQLVAACVYGGGGDSGAWVSPKALERGKDCWPHACRSWPARNVLSVLLDMERLDLVGPFDAAPGGFLVSLREVAA